MNRVTIKTVAEEAGVSIKTVSRVLNKEPGVRASTKEKVQLVINRLGYEPSPAAQALAGNKSKIIGLVYDNPSAAYVMAVQTGALRACSNEDYNLVIHPCDHLADNLTEQLIALVQKSRLDGLILTPPICDKQDTTEALIAAGIHVVSVAPAKQDSMIPSVSCNDAIAVEQMIVELIDQGHTRIGFILGHENHGAAYQRFVGYQNALHKKNIDFDQSLVIQGEFSYESGVQAAQILMALADRPTAIFASNDYMAAGVMTIAHEFNIKVPDDLSIIGFDDAPVSRQIWPLLTTVRQPVDQMSEAVTRLLIAKIKGEKLEQLHQRHNAEIIIRHSARL